uniref:Uncharacterized protein n=1 Tax=Glossina pallidipes TaxID=7398 RepID=A0A1A9ZHM7_GLOPL
MYSLRRMDKRVSHRLESRVKERSLLQNVNLRTNCFAGNAEESGLNVDRLEILVSSCEERRTLTAEKHLSREKLCALLFSIFSEKNSINFSEDNNNNNVNKKFSNLPLQAGWLVGVGVSVRVELLRLLRRGLMPFCLTMFPLTTSSLNSTSLNATPINAALFNAPPLNVNNSVPIGIAVARKRPQESTAASNMPPIPSALSSSSTLPLSQSLNKDMNCFGIRVADLVF